MDLAKQHEKNTESNLLSDEPACIGPITNIFRTERLDPKFNRNLECLYIIGGNCTVARFTTRSSKI